METHLDPTAVLTVLSYVGEPWGRRRTVLSYLARKAAEEPPGRWIPLPRSELRDVYGMSRNWASKTLRRLRQEELVEYRPSRGRTPAAYRIQADVTRWSDVPWIDRDAALFEAGIVVARSCTAPHEDFVARSCTAPQGFETAPQADVVARTRTAPQNEVQPIIEALAEALWRALGPRHNEPDVARTRTAPQIDDDEAPLLISVLEREKRLRQIKQAIDRAGGWITGTTERKARRLIIDGLDVDAAVEMIDSRPWEPGKEGLRIVAYLEANAGIITELAAEHRARIGQEAAAEAQRRREAEESRNAAEELRGSPELRKERMALLRAHATGRASQNGDSTQEEE